MFREDLDTPIIKSAFKDKTFTFKNNLANNNMGALTFTETVIVSLLFNYFNRIKLNQFRIIIES